jgi:2,3-bisphosphoglycerate-dependent phosphoglycerate mutase
VPTLILLRHGESEWNSRNVFTGWVDVPLTPRGEEQARRSGRQLRAAGLLPDVLHTSLLSRALRTGVLALQAAGRADAPVRQDWRLNERHYGALQGADRSQTRARYGDQQFQLWRRSYDGRPPPISPGSAWDVADDPRYAALPHGVPTAESLADVVRRLLPYWHEGVVPDLRAGRTVLLTAHSNSLRALVAHLDALTPLEVLALNIPTGMPLVYQLEDDLRPAVRGGRYLEPAAARRAAAAVAQAGQPAAPAPRGQSTSPPGPTMPR